MNMYVNAMLTLAGRRAEFKTILELSARHQKRTAHSGFSTEQNRRTWISSALWRRRTVNLNKKLRSSFAGVINVRF